MDEVQKRDDVEVLSKEDYVELMEEISAIADVNATASQDEIDNAGR